MCTVTYIPINEKYFVSSNRDEKNSRSQAILPTVYNINNKKLIFPKDAEAGGSWIALHENGKAAVLLNGAFVKHVSAPPYHQSRGQIFLHIISQEQPLREFHRMDLLQIEPFTLILVDDQNLYECRWDGNEKYCRQLKKHRPYIWSSATLYDEAVIKKREQWFAAFLNRNPRPTQNDILGFHQFAGEGDVQNDLLMERDGSFSTVSITSMLLTADRGSMKYLDIKRKKMMEKKIQFSQPFAIIC